MYTCIVVALDGSEIAERVLPYVAALAQKFEASVTLVRATTPPETIVAQTTMGSDGAAGMIVDPDSLVEDERQEASAYLADAAERLRRQGLTVDDERPEGPAAEVVVRRARELGADLIAMTTHGRGGLGRLVFGSVADEVLRTAPCPVLLVRVSEEENGQS